MTVTTRHDANFVDQLRPGSGLRELLEAILFLAFGQLQHVQASELSSYDRLPHLNNASFLLSFFDISLEPASTLVMLWPKLFSFLSPCFAAMFSTALAANAGSFADGGNTLISAMMVKKICSLSITSWLLHVVFPDVRGE